jgi:hypothetical protein
MKYNRKMEQFMIKNGQKLQQIVSEYEKILDLIYL